MGIPRDRVTARIVPRKFRAHLRRQSMPIASIVLRASYMREIPTWPEVFHPHCRISGEPASRKHDAPSGTYTYSPASLDNLNAFDTSRLRVLAQRSRR